MIVGRDLGTVLHQQPSDSAASAWESRTLDVGVAANGFEPYLLDESPQGGIYEAE